MKILVEIHSMDGRGNVLTLKRPFDLIWNGRVLHIPEGTESDGASVPFGFRWLVSPCIHQCTLRAAIAHDYLYGGNVKGWTKSDADGMFRDICIEDGLASFRAWIAYAGLRCFGGPSWLGKYVGFCLQKYILNILKNLREICINLCK